MRHKSLALLTLSLFLAACGPEPTSPAATGGEPEVAASSALTATVSGPTQVRPSATCTWEAVVSGGTAPYEYRWSTLWNPGRTWTTDHTFSVAFGSSQPELIQVEVRDALGTITSDGLGIQVTNSAPAC